MNADSDSAQMLAYEDFTPGTRFELGPYPVSAEEIVAFAGEFDPQPMHLDEAAGKASLLGGLAASGWHTSSIMMRMIYDGFLSKSLSQGAPGVDFAQWKRPVLAGDTLRGETKVLSARPMASRPGLGVIKLRHEIVNQRGELVCACENPVFIRMREGPVS